MRICAVMVILIAPWLLAACGPGDGCEVTATCEVSSGGGSTGGNSTTGGGTSSGGSGGSGATGNGGGGGGTGGGAVTITHIAAGDSHTCASRSDGSVFCWGANDNGQLGTGNSVAASVPTPVSSLQSALKSLTAGSRHSCAVDETGMALCWGANDKGQLETGTSAPSTVPVAVSGLSNVAKVCAGIEHTCALAASQVSCWGGNTYGQLGNGTNQGSNLPVQVSITGNALDIECGGEHTCATTMGGQVVCWGRNTTVFGGGGQLGDGTQTSSSSPVVATNISLAAGVAAGESHSCGWTDDGTAFCWGYNTSGQLGVGDNAGHPTATEVSGLAGVSNMAGGRAHTCSVAAGSVMCWGANGSGQLGTGDQQGFSTPQGVAGLTNVGAVVAGGDHSCARTGSGSVACWGLNADGQLGNGSTTASTTPVNVDFGG